MSEPIPMPEIPDEDPDIVPTGPPPPPPPDLVPKEAPRRPQPNRPDQRESVPPDPEDRKDVNRSGDWPVVVLDRVPRRPSPPMGTRAVGSDGGLGVLIVGDGDFEPVPRVHRSTPR